MGSVCTGRKEGGKGGFGCWMLMDGWMDIGIVLLDVCILINAVVGRCGDMNGSAVSRCKRMQMEVS